MLMPTPMFKKAEGLQIHFKPLEMRAGKIRVQWMVLSAYTGEIIHGEVKWLKVAEDTSGDHLVVEVSDYEIPDKPTKYS